MAQAETWIALETSGDRASVAVGNSARVAAEELIAGSRRHAVDIIPALERVIRRASVDMNDLAGVLLADGPGSFTGLRVGGSVAKALARVHHLPLRKASALLVLARAAWRAHDGGDRRILAATDALRGEIYAAEYRITPALVEVLIGPAVVAPAALCQWPRADIVAGEVKFPPELGGEPVSGEAVAPRASVLLDLLGVEGGTSLIHDLETWEPEYGRPAEAQARWEAAHGRRLPDSTGTTR